MIRLCGAIASLTILIVAVSAACSPTTPPPGETASPTSNMTTTETGEGQTPTEASPTSTETDSSQIPTEAPTTEGSESVVASPEVDPAGPDFTLFTLPECSVVPGGAISGADAFTMLVALRNSGPGTWNNLVPFRVSSDTGLSGQGNTTVSTGTAFTAMQVDLTASDYSRAHRFTITADPDNQVRESDETNNELTISVALPPRPTSTTNITCSSP
jgi:CARDB